MISFEVRGIPQQKGSKQMFWAKKRQRPIVVDMNPKAKGWQQTVALTAQRYAPDNGLWLGPVALELLFTLAKPKSLPKQRPSWAIRRPDLGKLARTIEDALTGVVYKDDSQIIYESLKKEYGNAPGVSVVISQVPQDLSLPGEST